jgi:hypothetical protein
MQGAEPAPAVTGGLSCDHRGLPARPSELARSASPRARLRPIGRFRVPQAIPRTIERLLRLRPAPHEWNRTRALVTDGPRLEAGRERFLSPPVGRSRFRSHGLKIGRGEVNFYASRCSSYFGAPRRSFMKSTNARTFGESSRLLAKTMFTSRGGIDHSGKSGTSWPEASAGRQQ